MEPITVVPMAAEHIEAVAALERACFSAPWSATALTEELDNPPAVFRVAIDAHGTVLGYMGMHHVGDEGFVTNVAVSPEYRRQGIASALLDVFTRFAEGNKLAFLTLEVRDANAAARALYARHGYAEVGRRKNYYEHPKEDAIIMTREFKHAETETADA